VADAEKIASSVMETAGSADEVAKSLTEIVMGAEQVSKEMQQATEQTGNTIEMVKDFADQTRNNQEGAARVKNTSSDLSAVSEQLVSLVEEYKTQ